MRHLSELQAVAALTRGAAIEQMLSEDLNSGSFRWLEARAAGSAWVLKQNQTLDEGSDDFIDVYEFGSRNDDDASSDTGMIGEFADPHDLLLAAVQLGARVDRWVNAGVIQDEYGALRSRR